MLFAENNVRASLDQMRRIVRRMIDDRLAQRRTAQVQRDAGIYHLISV